MDYHISNYTVSVKSLLPFALFIGALSFTSPSNAAPREINRTITPSVYVAPGEHVAYYVRYYYNRPYYSPYYRTYYRPYYRPYYYRPYYRPYYYNRYYYRW
ncbi:hypothetical protein [Legionella shakespearei]|uniref:Uncharacterized protein n=2 Tax=Legionella shakespearei TaxID=45075 RepID=A0A0W0YM24_9GAMM|nr:hypothetical protein [Legionella shakespearei]KTD57635.1 hypothetical protein Lsha_2476 [Legionella shakespearei DSM 23087]